MKKNDNNTDEQKVKKLALIEKRKQKKAEVRAKKAAKRAAMLEKKRAKAAAKKAKREERKQKKMARLQKLKERKAAIREKKRAAKIKAQEQAKVKKAKEKIQLKKIQKQAGSKLVGKNTDGIDIKLAAKNIKLAMTQIASEMSAYDDATRIKKAKSIRWMGYDVETKDGEVIVRFDVEKTKKIKIEKPASSKKEENNERKPRTPKNDEQPIVPAIEGEPLEEPAVEMIPAGDLLASDGQVDEAEIANIEDDDTISIDDPDDNDDMTIPDSRDEQDDDLVENRQDFFANFGDDGELND